MAFVVCLLAIGYVIELHLAYYGLSKSISLQFFLKMLLGQTLQDIQDNLEFFLVGHK